MDAWERLNAQITACERCPRLVSWRQHIARVRRRAYQNWEYWGKPVIGFGDLDAQVLIVGLAPGAHGSNRTGRMFTGDESGHFLYRALYNAGFCSQPAAAHRDDGLILNRVFISAVCRCVPPDNQPTRSEMENCFPYLSAEIQLLQNISGVVALGRIAFEQVFRHYQPGVRLPKFRHGGFFTAGGGKPWMIASYHPSRQNTQTGRLTEAMFADIWRQVRERLN
ncbi:MAG: uracil-DNA glycosylase [Bellilinea sp.]|jgi:uracil-DNA glycosylase family 4